MSAFLDLPPARCAQGSARLPGSKSISNRVLLLAALAEGDTHIHDLLHSDDVARMLEALEALGVRWERTGAHDYVVHGTAGAPFPVREAELFLGNAGTAFRPLTAVLALMDGEYRLRGVPRMHERPIGDLVEALRQLGARIDYLENEGYPPLAIHPPAPVSVETVRIRGDVSSQFLSALLMALPLLGRPITVEVVGELISRPYVALTLALMARFGVELVERDGRFHYDGQARYRSPGEVYVEGDASSASYFLAAGVLGCGPVRVEGVGRTSLQGDVRFAEALEALGARVAMGENWIEASAPENGRLRAFDLDLNHIPDAAMTLAVVALFCDGPSRLRHIGSWRVKETDRIAAMATELRKLGATVEEGPDFLVITPPERLQSAAIATYDDHRMAMCFSLAAFGDIYVRILEPECVNKTFPEYWQVYRSVVRPVPVVAIDGPTASGKGTVAARLAERLGWHYLDSGALYRLVALAALRRGLATEEAAMLARLARDLDVRFSGDRILLAGEDVTEAIRTEDVSAAASRIAVHGTVREALLARQRAFRRRPGLVAEGRDMGSVVFPDAELKVFLTASVEVRAERRFKQLIDKGMSASIERLREELEARDRRDRERAIAPLQQCPDALRLDTSHIGVEEAVEAIFDWVRTRGLA